MLGNLTPLSTAARERALDDARTVLSDGVRVFGRRAATGVSAPWSQDPESGREWPPDEPWWRIDIRTEQRLGDVKFVWEAARHRDLIVLARAYRVDPDGSWLTELERLVTTWCAQNAPERGVNWYSSLELALRAVAWTQVLTLAGERLSPSVREAMDIQLFASARHLMIELPYTMSSMKNNHLLGDSLGIILLARMFPGDRRARRWNRLGERLFAAQLARHMRPDGSMIEDSVSYHRFVLEMLVVRVLIGDAPPAVIEAMGTASLHLARLGVFDGPLPQYGDWDEGRVLASSGDALDLAGSTALGLSLAGEAVPAAWFEEFDELAWYARPDAVRDPLRLHRPSSCAVSGGIAHVAAGPWRVWFKVAAGPSHGHADLTSVWVQHQRAWLVGDPGTGTYNGPIDVRNGLRTSAAHPVVRVDGADQLVPHRAFRWLGTATGHLAPVANVAGRHVLFGWHDAYERIAPGLQVARVLVIDEKSVTVLDWVSPQGLGRRWELTVPLAPGVSWTGTGLATDSDELPVAGLDDATPLIGSQKPFAGWHSSTYGSWAPTTWLVTGGTSAGSSWQIGEGPHVEVYPQSPSLVGDLQFEIDWSSDCTSLVVTDLATAKSTVMRT